MKKNKPVKIAVVEDHEDIRNGIVFIINNYAGFECTGFKSAEEILQHVKTEAPDVIIMDINLPGINGIECTRKIKDRNSEILILMCTVFEEAEDVFEALKAGANGYILKRTTSETLIEGINELLRGGAPMSSDIARKVVNSFHQKPAINHSLNIQNQADLTQKENQILCLLAEGYSSKEIATRLFISVNTVKTHIYRIYDKLHVHSKIEAINKIKKEVVSKVK